MKALRVPLLLFALPSLLIAFAPARHGLLLLDRAALDAGEVWRLWSGHWVHFSSSHLLWNLVVLLAAGTWLEHMRPGLLLRYTLLAAPLLSMAILIGEPGLKTYGGLSGLATGVVVLLGCHQLRAPGPARWVWAGMLILVAVKSTHDAIHPVALFVHYNQADFRTSSTAHAAGAIIAVFHYAAIRLAKTIPPGPMTGSRRQGSG